MTARFDVDVGVVGAGPAGLVTAIACAERGLSVRVLDRRSAPIDKACGEGLMPDGLAVLDELGVALPAHRPFRGIRYLDERHSVEGRFPGRSGCGIRRPELHGALLDRARAIGVDVCERVAITGLYESSDSVRWVLDSDSGLVAPRWIVGADGLHSKLRHWSGLASGELRSAPRRFGIRCHFRVCPWTDFVEVYWSDGAEAYVTPVASDVVGVAVLWSPARSTPESAYGAWHGGDSDAHPGIFDRLLRSFPVLADRLGDVGVVSRVMAAGPLRQRARGVTAGNLALVGDAAGYVDAITGEGMALAFHQAVDLADAIAAGDLSTYPAAHRRHRRVPNLLTEAALVLARSSRIRRRALAALAGEPGLFDRILAVQSGEAEPRTLVSAQLGRGASHFVMGH